MKHFILIAILLITGCSQDYDDSQLWNNVNSLKDRVEKLEEVCNKLNTNIISLQAIVEAVQKSDAIKDVTTLSDGTGYLISFVSGKSITIYHGQDGKNGINGTNGIDGVTPIISVKQDSNGIYYWTVNNEWLLDSIGNRVKAVGIDGNNGDNGFDGITPQFKIENDYWYISYDNELTWELLGRATGDDGTDGKDGADGTNGQDGDNFFKDIVIKDGYIYLTLNDTEATVLQVPFYTSISLTVHIQEAGTLKSLLTNEQKRTLLSLKLIGVINEEDMKTINSQMLILEKLDLSETTYYDIGSFSINPYGTSLINRTLKEVILPPSEYSSLYRINCLNLEKLTVTSEFYWNYSDFTMCENLDTLVFSEGITYVPSNSCPNFHIIIFPSTLKRIEYKAFSMVGPEIPTTDRVICKAITPPSVGYINVDGNFTNTTFYDHYKPLSEYTLLVPSESIGLYKEANGWKQFGTIIGFDENDI